MFFAKSKASGKERSTDKPSWASHNQVNSNLSAEENAKNIMDNRYAPGNWNTPIWLREFSQIKKWIQRHILYWRFGISNNLS